MATPNIGNQELLDLLREDEHEFVYKARHANGLAQTRIAKHPWDGDPAEYRAAILDGEPMPQSLPWEVRRIAQGYQVRASLPADLPLPMVFAAGRTNNRLPYITRAWVGGFSFHDTFLDASEPLRESYLDHLLTLLECLHRENVIIQDLKPDNLVVDHGKVWLIDIESLRICASGAEIPCTHFTPGYNAPEQGEKGKSGQTSDVYAFGRVVGELLEKTQQRKKTPSPWAPKWSAIATMCMSALGSRPTTSELRLLLGAPAATPPNDTIRVPEPSSTSVALDKKPKTSPPREPKPETSAPALRDSSRPKRAEGPATPIRPAPPPNPKPGERKTIDCGGVSMELVWVPPGKFWMGASKTPGRNHDPEAFDTESPVREVRLTCGFWLGRHPVVVAQYRAFCRATRRKEPTFVRPEHAVGDNPVTCVSWEDACAFAAWLRTPDGLVGALPTEAEWEYAARGTDGRRFPWGNEPPDGKRAWWAAAKGGPDEWLIDLSDEEEAKAPQGPAPVGGRPTGRSPFGAEDMAGNVWEWCRDAWGDQQLDIVVDPCRHDDDPEALRVVRGGAWLGPSRFLRCSYRFRYLPWDGSDFLGFRVVLRPSLPG